MIDFIKNIFRKNKDSDVRKEKLRDQKQLEKAAKKLLPKGDPFFSKLSERRKNIDVYYPD